ncbi:hypothetical protein ACU5AX_03385 [Sphingomonas sp. XXL09]|nr:hypothetical protein [Sphingomonas sp. MA1305]
MNRVNAFILRAGLDPAAVKRRALGGVIIGLTVVAIDRVMGFGS